MEKYDLRKDGQFGYDEDERDPVILLAAKNIGADISGYFALEVDAESCEDAIRKFGLWDCMCWRQDGEGLGDHGVTYEVIPESAW